MTEPAEPDGIRIVWPDRPADSEIVLPGWRAPGKPRQTRRSKFIKTPGLVKYYAFADALRIAAADKIPPAETVQLIAVTAYYRPPPSWSKKRAHAAYGTPKRSKPDPDNILKGVLDIIWPQGDQYIGDCHGGRWWATADAVFVSIWT